MRVPTIHINGTDAKSLREQLLDAVTAVRHAQNKLLQAMPHGRDYYVQDGDAINEAQAEMRARIAKLGEVEADLVTLYEGIVTQPGGLKR